MALSLSLLRLFPRETCLASVTPDEASVGKLRERRQFSVIQRVAEKQMLRLSSKGDDFSSLELDSAKSANLTRESKLQREQPSHSRETSFSAMNPRMNSSSAEQGKTEDVNSKFASSKVESTLQEILNDFKSSERRSVLQGKKARFRSRKDERTADPRGICRNLSGKLALDALKGRAVSEETDLVFDDSSNGVANTSERKNDFTERSHRLSSALKSHIPIGKKDIDTSTQNGNVPPQRRGRSNSSWSSSSKSSIPKRSLKDSWMSESKDRAAGSSTSTSVSDSSSRQPSSLFSSKEMIKSHNILGLDGGNVTHESGDDFHIASRASRSSSSASSQELRSQMSPQLMETSSFESLSDAGFEYVEGFSLKASSDSVGVENRSRKSPVSRRVMSVSSVPEQGAADSDVEDDVVDGSRISTSGVGPNSMSLPKRAAFCSEERAFDSTTFLDSNPDDDTSSLSDNEANTSTTSCAVTKKGSVSSVPASRFDHNPSAKYNLGVESGGAGGSSPSDPAVPQGRVKTQPVWDHPLSDLPFELQYSYSETPNAPIIGFRWGSQFSPFGLTTRGRPWTGSAPLKPSKKKLPEFDSFKPPPRGKKGIKYVQDPGPYPKGQGPHSAYSREQIIGEPLSNEEVVQLVEKSLSDRRQVNLGRDGLTHNMLDVIHAHWKRRRVCKIKCLGVPTVDMDNVCFYVEEKTGGKIIYRTGGVLYLFRGRNYNYIDRPRIPLMLWKPATPIYPKLIEKAPGGLTEEQANQLRTMGGKIAPFCKLAKNGVYLNLVNDVRTAFKVDDLVRIDCQGLNPSDYKKIGAKLKDLVPCILLSFEKEHILMWKGKDVNASLVDTNSRDTDACVKAKLKSLENATSFDGRCLDFRISNTETSFQFSETQSYISMSASSQVAGEGISSTIPETTQIVSHLVDVQAALDPCHSVSEDTIPMTRNNGVVSTIPEGVKDAFLKEISDEADECRVEATCSVQIGLDKGNLDKVDCFSEHRVLLESLPQKGKDSMESISTGEEGEETVVLPDIELKNKDQIERCSVEVDTLWQQALESGIAIALDETDLDMDSVLKKSDELVHEAPPGPVYTRSLVRKLQLRDKKKTEVEETKIIIGRKKGLTKKTKAAKWVAGSHEEEGSQRGGIPVNELARLLA